MAETKTTETKTTAKVGEAVIGAHLVVRPDGSRDRVSHGAGYVYEVPGTYLVDDQEVTVK